MKYNEKNNKLSKTQLQEGFNRLTLRIYQEVLCPAKHIYLPKAESGIFYPIISLTGKFLR